jgi:photosynthetic reaction center cytochrome c subunit
MNRKLAILLTFLSAAFAQVVPATKAQAHPAPSSAALQSGTKTAEQVFKNIQVLKGVAADRLIPTMQFVSASLGVECDFCHVQGAFEKDDKKPKQIARKMMEMTFAINADDFDRQREVTCYSCHRGSTNPLTIPGVAGESGENINQLMEPEPEGKAEAKPSAGPTADQLLEKYLKASGGATAIENITTRVMKGTIDFGSKSFPIEIYDKAAAARISFTHMPEGESVTGFNGHEGWLAMTGRPLREMHGSDLEAAAIDADLHLPLHLQQMFSGLKVRGTAKIDNHDTYIVEGDRAEKPPMFLYFDEQTGLLLRMLRFADTALGTLPTQIEYADYHENEGVQIPFRWTLARPGGRFTVQIIEMQQNVPIDETKFAKPQPPPTEGSKPQ